ncbi:MAG: 5-(carboxyamino)imidazole ribonucleotide synthase [Chthoniobacteraceae bacterium]
MSDGRTILPGATLGVMGSGQLGRMFAIAARRMGYRVHTFSPDSDTPTGQVADLETTAAYDDEAAVREFAKSVAVLTFEFENVPSRTVEWAAAHCPVRPSGKVLHICQHRLREKEFLAGAGIPVAPFRKIDSAAQLAAAAAEIGLPGVLKTAAFGYDGKGQRKLKPGDDLAEAWRPFEGQPAVLEKFIPFEREISVIVARGLDGAMTTWPVCENEHANHILDVTLCPARLPATVAARAAELARSIAVALDLTGVLAVEMFLMGDGTIFVNELAPRPHNSGHFSFDASVTSQFEQQVRAVCGLPLGSTESLRPSAMANLLGDEWSAGEPDWAAVAAFPEVKIHLYGKASPKPGRKMGHLTAFGETVEQAAATVRAARLALAHRP